MAVGGRRPDIEGLHADFGAAGHWQLAAPTHFAPATQDREDTAFREDEAGFSAYYRVPDGDTTPSLDVWGIYAALLDPPDENNSVRSAAGRGEELGANFAIVTVEMYAAMGVPGATTDVTLYFDDQGWIVAYLPAEAPASQIWRHESAAGETSADSKANDHLKDNLLALAIDETLTINKAVAAGNPAAPRDKQRAPRDKLGYYHWRHPECNAFLLFGNTAADGDEPDIVRFVIPTSIKAVHASAAALITSHPVAGAETTARVTVDKRDVVTARSGTPLAADTFDLVRDKAKTSLHSMTVAVDDGKSAAGVVMLMYAKP